MGRRVGTRARAGEDEPRSTRRTTRARARSGEAGHERPGGRPGERGPPTSARAPPLIVRLPSRGAQEVAREGAVRAMVGGRRTSLGLVEGRRGRERRRNRTKISTKWIDMRSHLSRTWRSLGRRSRCIAVGRVAKTMSRGQFLPNLDSDRHVPTTHRGLSPVVSFARSAGASALEGGDALRVAPGWFTHDARVRSVRARAPDATRIRARDRPGASPSHAPVSSSADPAARASGADASERQRTPRPRARRSARPRPPPSRAPGRTFASRASPRSFAPPRAPSRVPRLDDATRSSAMASSTRTSRRRAFESRGRPRPPPRRQAPSSSATCGACTRASTPARRPRRRPRRCASTSASVASAPSARSRGNPALAAPRAATIRGRRGQSRRGSTGFAARALAAGFVGARTTPPRAIAEATRRYATRDGDHERRRDVLVRRTTTTVEGRRVRTTAARAGPAARRGDALRDGAGTFFATPPARGTASCDFRARGSPTSPRGCVEKRWTRGNPRDAAPRGVDGATTSLEAGTVQPSTTPTRFATLAGGFGVAVARNKNRRAFRASSGVRRAFRRARMRTSARDFRGSGAVRGGGVHRRGEIPNVARGVFHLDREFDASSCAVRGGSRRSPRSTRRFIATERPTKDTSRRRVSRPRTTGTTRTARRRGFLRRVW